MTEREAIIILSMFADQYKGKTIHSILNNNDDDIVNEFEYKDDFLFPFVSSIGGKVILFYDDKSQKIKSFNYDELNNNKCLDYINLDDSL